MHTLIEKQAPWRSVVAIVVVPAAAAAVQWAFWDYVQPFTWFFFWPGLFVSALIGSKRDGILASIVSTALVWWWFVPPAYTFFKQQPIYYLYVPMFIGVGVLVNILQDRLKRSRKRIVELLLESERSRQLLLETLSDGVFIAQDYRFVSCNHALPKILDYEDHEFVGLEFERVVAPEFLELWTLRYEQRIGDGPEPEKNYEVQFLRRNGEKFWVELRASRTQYRNRPAVMGVIHDIAHRKLAELALKESESALREAQHLAGLGSWSWNVLTGVHIWSEEIYRIYGRDPSLPPAIYPEVRSYFTPNTWARLSAAVGRCLATGEPYEVDVEVVRPDGGRRWIAARGEAVRDSGGAVVKLHGTLHDITARKKLENEVLERRNEMEALQKRQVAAQTAAAVAHELNQPLLAIATYCEAAAMLLEAPTPNLEKIRQAVEASGVQAHRAGQSIRELLGFLSISEFTTEPFDLRKVIEETLEATRAEQALQFQAEYRWDAEPLLVRANRTHVQKVLSNLLNNSVEAMQEAAVPLPAIAVSVQAGSDRQVVRVTVRDNGPGFRPENIAHLFEPFFTTKSHGIGVGLAISRALIEANGGQLWVDPEEGPGATFHFTLPRLS